MADSVDRVFVYALNTVKKIPRTGSARPPPADRLKLYGLYKQSMEGDIEGVMDRPEGDSVDTISEREKWDAWNANAGLSRTEAKRRYITTLIATMHRYASPTPEARALVSELEFVWDQIKHNSASDSSDGSPLRTGRDLGIGNSGVMLRPPPHPAGLDERVSYASLPGDSLVGNGNGKGGRAAEGESTQSRDRRDARQQRGKRRKSRNRERARERRSEMTSNGRLRILSPVSQADAAAEARYNRDHRSDDDDDNASDNQLTNSEVEETENDSDLDSSKSSYTSDGEGDHNKITRSSHHHHKSSSHSKHASHKWRTRIETALTKTTTELAALREILEFQSLHASSPYYFSSSSSRRLRRQRPLLYWTRWLLGVVLRHVLLDLLLLVLVAGWRRWKWGDRRLERFLVGKVKNGWQWIGWWVLLVRRGGWRKWIRGRRWVDAA